MPLVTKHLGTIETPNNPMDVVKTGSIDLAMLLSEHYGKNIRQGNNFTITGVQAYLKPHDDNSVTDDYDTGGSALVQCSYVPTTGHSRKAWNQAFRKWAQMQRLQSIRGAQPRVRNEDFELAYDYANKDSVRTSKMYSSHADTTAEYACLTGDTTNSEDWCLSDFYNTTNPAPQKTASHYDGSLYKGNKYGSTPFPATQFFATTAKASNVVTISSLLSGGDFEAEFTHFPQPLQVLCGLLKYDVQLIPGDTSSQIEDNLDLYITIAVKKWKPLVFRPKRKKMSKFARRKSSGRRFSRKRSRR